ncbi:MAG: hypothetical protein QOI61_720 [Actinomycetota bacterium]|jgi:hypothetical protein
MQDQTSRVLSWAAVAIAVIAIAEMIGTMTVGLAVNVNRMNFPIRQGYAFLTNLEKSPVGIALIVASVFGAIAVFRAGDDESPGLATPALWGVVAAGAILAVATILAVLARFRVAELVASQPVDALTRRVLVVFVIRNFGSALVAVVIAVTALFRTKPQAEPVVEDAVVVVD